MRIQNKNNQKNIVIIIVIAVVLITGGALLVNRNSHRDTTLPPQAAGPTPEQKQAESAANADAKQKLVEDLKTTGVPSSNPPATPATPSIELSAQTESSASVTVFTKLHTISSGTCNLTVKNGVKQTTQTANIIYQAEYSTCAGFSVPITPLGSGTWDIALAVSSNGQTYTNNITYTVK